MPYGGINDMCFQKDMPCPCHAPFPGQDRWPRNCASLCHSTLHVNLVHPPVWGTQQANHKEDFCTKAPREETLPMFRKLAHTLRTLLQNTEQ